MFFHRLSGLGPAKLEVDERVFHYPIGLWACGKSGAVDISARFLGASDECSTSLGNAPCSFCIHSVSVNFDRNMSAALGASFFSFLLH